MGRGTSCRLALLAIVGTLAACGGDGTDETTSTAAATGANGCSTVTPPEAAERHAAKPKQRLDPSKSYSVTVTTNCGSFTIDLAVKTSPATTASFVSLARKGFFDHTVFHRIVPGFVIQGGDPTASGTGGPGYTTVDTPPKTARYTTGIAAMAKSQTEAPGTGGSQFFVVTAPDAGLPPEYAILGEVEDGLDVVKRIGELGDPGTEQPTQVVEIQKATVSTR